MLNENLQLKNVFSQVSYSVIIFVIGMFIVVKGIQNTGLTEYFGKILLTLSSENMFKSIVYTSFLTAIGSNLINNVPMDMLMVSVIKSMPISELTLPMSYATILGAGLGPNLTIIGSLATMLWLGTIRRKNVDITPIQYLKVGLLTAPIMILFSSIALYLTY